MLAPQVSKAYSLMEHRDKIADELGDSHRAVVSLSAAIIGLLRTAWIPPAKPRKPTCHLLHSQNFITRVLEVYRNSMSGTCNGKLPAIKFVRDAYATKYGQTLGLLEAKLYVEHICQHDREPEFLTKLPGYVPF